MKYYMNRTSADIAIPIKAKNAKAIIEAGQLLTEREIKLIFGKIPQKFIPRLIKEVEISSAKTEVIFGKRFERRGM